MIEDLFLKLFSGVIADILLAWFHRYLADEEYSKKVDQAVLLAKESRDAPERNKDAARNLLNALRARP